MLDEDNVLSLIGLIESWSFTKLCVLAKSEYEQIVCYHWLGKHQVFHQHKILHSVIILVIVSLGTLLLKS